MRRTGSPNYGIACFNLAFQVPETGNTHDFGKADSFQASCRSFVHAEK